jgi:hypothetical protein
MRLVSSLRAAVGKPSKEASPRNRQWKVLLKAGSKAFERWLLFQPQERSAHSGTDLRFVNGFNVAVKMNAFQPGQTVKGRQAVWTYRRHVSDQPGTLMGSSFCNYDAGWLIYAGSPKLRVREAREGQTF